MKIFNKDTKKDLVFIAEIGVNHEGNLKRAKKMIHLAAKSGADAVKFQSYSTDRFVSVEDNERKKRVNAFNLNDKSLNLLSNYAKKKNIHIFSSAITEDKIDLLKKKFDVIKIASGDIDFKPTLIKAAKSSKKIILSTGCSDISDIQKAVAIFKKHSKSKNIKNRLILMHCVSLYPTNIELANIKSIQYIKDKTGLEVGYSNHVIEPEAIYAAVANGSNLIELHFTDNKKRKFRDNHLSFTSVELKKIIKISEKIKTSLGKYNKIINEYEKNIKQSIRKGLAASKNLRKNHIISKKDIMFTRNANYYSSNDLNKILGKKLKKPILYNQVFKHDNFK